jgi:hypothetical protein
MASAVPGLTEWGTPVQWWDASAYPKPTAPLTLWAWEFLRRNPEYRKFWREKALPFYDTTTGVVDEEAHWAAQQRLLRRWPLCFEAVNLREQAERRFGVFGDPCGGWRRWWGFRTSGTKVYRPLSGEIIAAMKKAERPWGGHQLNLEGNEVAIVFNADWPIGPQLERAHRVLNMYRLKGAKIPRPRPELFPSYLQILDATDSGVGTAGIAAALFPEIDDSHPEYKASQLVRGRLKIARDMRDQGYRYLAAL